MGEVVFRLGAWELSRKGSTDREIFMVFSVKVFSLDGQGTTILPTLDREGRIHMAADSAAVYRKPNGGWMLALIPIAWFSIAWLVIDEIEYFTLI